MRKSVICILILILLIAPFSVVFTACSDKIKEYKGTAVSKVVYSSHDGWGVGSIKTLDFESNNITILEDNPYKSDEESQNLEIKEFSEEDGTYILNALYTYGLFKLKDEYPNDGIVMDGGSWRLTIYYQDGTEKVSYGGVNHPDKVFTKSAIVIYDTTGFEFWRVPQAYKEPPCVDLNQVSYYTDGFNQGSTMCGAGTRYKYKWHTTTLDNGDLYQFASTVTKASDGFKYTGEGTRNYLSIATTNSISYFNDEYAEKFSRCVVKQYDNNPELTNETALLDTGWIKPKKGKQVDIQKDKIYTVELTFSNDWYSIVVIVT